MKSTYANRGMQLERFIELTNKQYKRDKVAMVDKIATPVKVTHRTNTGKVTGFYEGKSTVDFIGIAQGRFIAFDAKETATKNLPFHSIHEHQEDYMNNVIEHGGRAFLIVRFSTLDRYFKIDIKRIMIYKEGCKAKSIPLNYFEKHAKELKFNDKGYVLDYLEIKGDV